MTGNGDDRRRSAADAAHPADRRACRGAARGRHDPGVSGRHDHRACRRSDRPVHLRGGWRDRAGRRLYRRAACALDARAGAVHGRNRVPERRRLVAPHARGARYPRDRSAPPGDADADGADPRNVGHHHYRVRRAAAADARRRLHQPAADRRGSGPRGTAHRRICQPQPHSVQVARARQRRGARNRRALRDSRRHPGCHLRARHGRGRSHARCGCPAARAEPRSGA